MKKNGIVEYQPIHEKFDPIKHMSVLEYEDNKIEEESIGKIVKSGFRMGDNILRTPLVGVVRHKSFYKKVTNFWSFIINYKSSKSDN